MKYTLYIDPGHDEEVIVYARERSQLTEELEHLVKSEKHSTPPIIGYKNDEIFRIDPEDVFCFYIENKRLYASLKDGEVLVKCRLYEIEDHVGEDFIRINQSTLANKNQIERFSVSIGAALCVHFKNGRKDYVSRRQLKSVKERLGIK